MTHLSTRMVKRSRWLLTAAALLFVYASLVHAGHWHDLDAHGQSQSTVCELCVGFDRLIDAPTAPNLSLPGPAADPPVPTVIAAPPAPRDRRGPQPRAPPLH